jgi:hypothetical protein
MGRGAGWIRGDPLMGSDKTGAGNGDSGHARNTERLVVNYDRKHGAKASTTSTPSKFLSFTSVLKIE